MIKCKVRIDKIFYPRDKEIENGDFAIFTARVLRVLEGFEPIKNPNFNTVSLKGNVPKIKVGFDFIIVFDNPEKNKFGTTYEVLEVIKEININNKTDVLEFLKLTCGNKIASELIKLENPYKLLIEKNSEELLKVKGIKKSRLEQIYKNVELYKDKSTAFVKLMPLGLTRLQIEKICEATGGAEGAINTCFNNPYSLIGKIEGFGFKTIDELALKCGMNPLSDIRIKACILHILYLNGEEGKSYLTFEQFVLELRKLIHLEIYKIIDVVSELCENREIIISDDRQKIALPYYLDLENNIAKEIKRILEAKSNIKKPDNWLETVRKIEEEQGWKFTDEQLEGIEKVLNNNLVVISGKAGTGKSTITNAMSIILENYMKALCCLSAKASQRLREVTGLESYTIHRLLRLNSEEEVTSLEEDIIILDEASMISGSIFYKLLKAIRSGSKIIILGDDGQLTAIGNCSVFRDMMNNDIVPHVELKKIHRQAEKSAIITKSIDFRNRKPICDKNFKGHITMGELKDLDLYVIEDNEILNQIQNSFLKEYSDINNIMEIQIITPLKNKGIVSCFNINNMIQKLFHNSEEEQYIENNNCKLFIGDKIINTKNDYNAYNTEGKKVGVYNGSIGIIKEFKKDNEGTLEIIADFSGIGEIIISKDMLKYINLAYAISCHSSQGSQWKRVIFTMNISSFVLLNVEMVYTSITRATEKCIFITDRKAFNISSISVENFKKQTFLNEILKTV